jgi:hypothetical protein
MDCISSFRSWLLLVFLCPAIGLSAEPTPRENAAGGVATRYEQEGDWVRAGYQWEQATRFAEEAGSAERAIAHCERALAAWRQTTGPASLDGQVYALGVMSKLDLEQGRITRGRERNLAALRIIDARIVETTGKPIIPGRAAPAGVPPNLLAAWVRGQRDTASWLDVQGRTVEAVELLTAAEISAHAAVADEEGNLRFYYRKLISTRAGMLKFLGFQERAIADLSALEESRMPSEEKLGYAQRFNLAYFRSQFYGPRPEYLDIARGILREAQASGNRVREVRRFVAKMAFAYGETGANIADLESVIAEARAEGAELEAVYAQRDLAVLGRKMGRRDGVEESLRNSLLEVRRRGVKRGEPTLYREYGEFLVEDGRVAEGLTMLHEAVRMTRAFGWTQHLPALLNEVASAQALLGDARGVAQTLAEINALIASGKLVPAREFLAHCARARALLLLGRAAEAGEAMARARTLADHVGLNEYQRFAEAWARDVTPIENTAQAAAAVAGGIVDLQPVAVVATAPLGEVALARFRLSNASASSAAGTITVRGRGVRIGMEDSIGVAEVTAGADDGEASASVPAQLGAGEEILIKIQGVAGSNASVRLEWQCNETTVGATCHIRADSTKDSDEPTSTVTNTSIAFENPFYAVHLHHPVRISDGDSRQSFRVKPSRRCRVEVIEANTGALLAVDADGDGAFTSLGDGVFSDSDADGFPDLPANQTGPGEIEVLVFPLPGSPPGPHDTRIEVQTKTATGWEHVAHDILKPPRAR